MGLLLRSAHLVKSLCVHQDPADLDNLGRVLGDIYAVLVAGGSDVDDHIAVNVQGSRREGGHGGQVVWLVGWEEVGGSSSRRGWLFSRWVGRGKKCARSKCCSWISMIAISTRVDDEKLVGGCSWPAEVQLKGLTSSQ